jgi:hypothetical protein
MPVSRRSAVARRVPARRLGLVLIVGVCGVLTAAASSSNASPGGLHILVTGTCLDEAVTPLAGAIQTLAGGATVTTFDTNAGTPTAAMLKSQNLVVSLGDTCGTTTYGYADATTWGNELATYVNQGGAVLQAAYDNWDANGASPAGQFASGGYAPFELGPNDNLSTTLGQLAVPHSPILKGLGTFATDDNTTDALAPGATLLAKWADGRNAIAIKGRVVSTTDSADLTDVNPADATLARLAVNTAKYFGTPDTKITKATISSTKHEASFKFKAVGVATGFQCELKRGHKKAAFKSCHSPKRYKNLQPGKYTFEVRAVGSGGFDTTPAKKSFRIK